jgi:hypothetical protein
MGEIRTQYGAYMGFTLFTAPDGVGLMMLYLAHDDGAQAQKAFDQEIAHAAKVVQRGEKRNGAGTVVGERAEILTPMSKPVPPSPAKIWTDGQTFHEITSSSLQDALELEKVYRY